MLGTFLKLNITPPEFLPGLRSRYPRCSLSSKGSSAAPVQLGPGMQWDLDAFSLTKPIHHVFPRGVVGRFEHVWNHRTFLKVYMELGSYFLFLQEQRKDIIILPHAPPAWE
jgi:hypothetical protein